jgi:hypothetical protein
VPPPVSDQDQLVVVERARCIRSRDRLVLEDDVLDAGRARTRQRSAPCASSSLSSAERADTKHRLAHHHGPRISPDSAARAKRARKHGDQRLEPVLALEDPVAEKSRAASDFSDWTSRPGSSAAR